VPTKDHGIFQNFIFCASASARCTLLNRNGGNHMGESDRLITTQGHSLASKIYSTFVLTEQEAKQHAGGFLDLIIAKGGNPKSFDILELESLFERHMGDSLEWRDKSLKAAAKELSESKIKAYNDQINAGKKRWQR
jgi:hypothetical protein